MPVQRRAFLTTALSASRVLGANDVVRVGLIGAGGRGRFVGRFMKDAGARFTAVCDAQQSVAERASTELDAPVLRDFRAVLASSEVDAVLIATPDHWHAPIAVLACRAGKAVYVEKPLALTVREGKAVVDAAAKTKQVVMPGTQHRSAPHFREVQDLVQSGAIGPVRLVRVWNFTQMLPDGIGRAPDSPVPPGVDWDLYCGPAPRRPFNPKRLGPTFRWFWDYATGTISDFGVHRFDTVHQIMNADSPTAVSASGGRFMLRDQGEMPDTLLVTYEYPGFVMSYEMSNINGFGLGQRAPGMRYYNMRGADDRPHGEAYYGSKGTIFADRVGYELYLDGKPPERRNTTDATRLHAANFVAAVQGKAAPATTVLNGHRATNIAHLGNIAYKTGRKLQWDAAREICTGDPEANRMLSREPRKPWNFI